MSRLAAAVILGSTHHLTMLPLHVQPTIDSPGPAPAAPKRIPRWVWGIAVALVCGVTAGLAPLSLQMVWDQNTICPGVTAAGVPVGGMTRAAAIDAIVSGAGEAVRTTYRLRGGGLQRAVTLAELGFGVDADTMVVQAWGVARQGRLFDRWREFLNVRRHGRETPLRLACDEQRLRRYLESLAPAVKQEAVNAEARVEQGMVYVDAGRWGVELDVEASSARIREMVAARTTQPLQIVTRAVRPDVAYEDLADVDTVLGEYSTRFRPWQRNRTHNLKLAVSFIDRHLLRPGETFSYNDTVGPRLEKTGYRPAPIFSDGEVVDSVGGGICQVATTGYNAALLAGLDIVARRNHSRPVDYAPVGRDATVYWERIDLRFRNSHQHPVYLRAHVEGSRVTVQVLGSHEDRVDVSIIRTHDQVLEPGVVEELDRTLPPGAREVAKPGRKGRRVTTLRVITRDGVELSRRVLSRDYYPPSDTVVRVGPSPHDGGDDKPGDGARPDRTPRSNPARGTRGGPLIEDLPE